MNHDHEPTKFLPTDPFDKLRSSMIGIPGGAHTKLTTVQHIDFYGHGTDYMIQTVRGPDEGVIAFVTQVDAEGAKRYILPQSVLDAINRQRESITTKLRRRHGKRIAEERAARGEQPGFMKAKRGKRK